MDFLVSQGWDGQIALSRMIGIRASNFAERPNATLAINLLLYTFHQIMPIILSKKLVTRYNELKQQALDCLLLMQVGAFMQVMNEDAKSVSKITSLQLQSLGEVGAQPTQ